MISFTYKHAAGLIAMKNEGGKEHSLQRWNLKGSDDGV
jgi:hypothetical protein